MFRTLAVEQWVNLGAFIIVLLGVAWTTRIIFRVRSIAKKNEKIDAVLAKAKKIGLLFRTNDCNGVMAVCADKDFLAAYRDFISEAEKDKRKLHEKVVLKVVPTFTFWQRKNAQRLIHVEGSKTLERIAIPFFENFFGITEEEMDSYRSAQKEEILCNLVVRDERLFVPFSGSASDMEEQEKLYGRKTVDDFTVFLFSIMKEVDRKAAL